MLKTVIFITVLIFNTIYLPSSIAAELKKEITVFGITLGKTLAEAGINECKIKNIGPTLGKQYDNDAIDCYQYKTFGQTACLTFIKRKFSFPITIETINSTKCNIESPVEQIRGLFLSEDYDKVLLLVTNKFGKPSKTENRTVTNKLGAQFNKIVNIWDIKGCSIYLTNMFEKIDEGLLTITDSKKVQSEIDKSTKNMQSDQQKF